MKFSIVIPNFQKSAYLRSTIESVLQQSFQDFEVLLVDDGSTDGSVEIAKSFIASNFHFFQQEHGGVSKARNLGFDKSIGEYVCFLDSDDIWKKDYLKTISSLIEKYPNAAAFGTRYSLYFNQQELPSQTQLSKDGDSLLNSLSYFKALAKAKNYPFLPSVMCYKKSALLKENLRFPEELKISEDIWLMSRLAFLNPIAISSETQVLYRIHAANNSSSRQLPVVNHYTQSIQELAHQNSLPKATHYWIQRHLQRHNLYHFKRYLKNTKDLIKKLKFFFSNLPLILYTSALYAFLCLKPLDFSDSEPPNTI